MKTSNIALSSAILASSARQSVGRHVSPRISRARGAEGETDTKANIADDSNEWRAEYYSHDRSGDDESRANDDVRGARRSLKRGVDYGTIPTSAPSEEAPQTPGSTIAASIALLQQELNVDIVIAKEFVYKTINYTDPDQVTDLLGLLVAEGECFTGIANEVSLACGPDCCLGNDSCNFEGTATVCRQSCVGRNSLPNLMLGMKHSCASIANGAVIFPNSCKGYAACNVLNSNSAVHEFPAVVGPNSCHTGSSCRDIMDNYTGGKVAIGSGSCLDLAACRHLAQSANTFVSIGNAACVGAKSCIEIGRANKDLQSLSIGDRSCVLQSACDGVGEYFGKYIEVGMNSCNGYKACFVLGQEQANTIVIEDGSCYGDLACEIVGEDNAHSVLIREGACVGQRACENVGDEPTSSVAIESNSCLGYRACRSLGIYTTGTITVGSMTCHGYRACNTMGFRGASGISIGENTCLGDEACYSVAYNTAGVNIQIASNACTGPKSCFQVGFDANTQVSIGDGACTSLKSCQRLGKSASAVVSIGVSACLSNFACYEFGMEAQGTTVAIPASVCTVAEENCNTVNDTACSASGCTQSFLMASPSQPCSSLCSLNP